MYFFVFFWVRSGGIGGVASESHLGSADGFLTHWAYGDSKKRNNHLRNVPHVSQQDSTEIILVIFTQPYLASLRPITTICFVLRCNRTAVESHLKVLAQ